MKSEDIDLTKIEKPIFLLDPETLARLQAHKGPIEIVTYKGWERVHYPQWNVQHTYRAAPTPPTKPSINWDHVAPKWVAMATDCDGSVFLYAEKPSESSSFWLGESSTKIVAFASFVPGTCDWRDSLVMRPGCEA